MANNQNRCLISGSRSCKASGTTEEVFIIGSGSLEFTTEINAILEILKGFGFIGNFALLSEKAKGYDAFCDKICSKIKQAQFCIILLNDPHHSQDNVLRVPSANVYYEFGMAVAQGKSVIPILKRGFKLPFDVQHLDAIIYDDIEDLKIKLKAPIVATLRKQQTPLTNNSDELQKQVYGPLYNEIHSFLTRSDRFSEFYGNQYSSILASYKYLLHKMDPIFQKKIGQFYSNIENFNRDLSFAQQVITGIVGNVLDSVFPVEKGRTVRMEIALTNARGQTTLPTLEQFLVRKVTPQTWYNAFGNSEIVLNVRYTVQISGYSDRRLTTAEGNTLFAKCQAIVEKNTEIIKLRKLERSLVRKGKELLEILKGKC